MAAKLTCSDNVLNGTKIRLNVNIFEHNQDDLDSLWDN